MQPGIYWSPDTKEITSISDDSLLPRGEWLHVTDDKDLGLIAARELLVARGTLEDASQVYWYLPQTSAEPAMHLYPTCDISDRPHGLMDRARDAIRGMFRSASPSLK